LKGLRNAPLILKPPFSKVCMYICGRKFYYNKKACSTQRPARPKKSFF
jgi:hypothetical protein